jgi:hypothetical protein
MRKFVILIAIILCLLLTSCGRPLHNEVIEDIRAEIAEEHGLPTEAVFVVEIKDCHSENADFYLVEVLIQDEDYIKATYVVQLDMDEDGLHIMEWQVKEYDR